ATGFLRTAPDPTYGEYKDTAECYQVLDDTITITTSALLGLTVHCARCHDHKFDPILQRDYYRLQAVFLAAYDPANWVVSAERGIAEGTLVQREHAKRINEQVEKELEKIKKQRAELSAEYAQRLFEQKLARLPEAIREDVRTALKTETAARNEVQKYLAEKFEKELKVEPAELLGAFPEFKAKDGEVDKALKAAEAERIPIPHIRGLADMGSVAPKAYILRRGDHRTPGEQVPPGVLEVLNQRAGGSGQQANGGQQAAGSGQTLWEGELPASVAQRSTGRRTALARWLTGPAHPLTARVMVNRIWQHHFGRGLVATPENFGRTGRPPSHPELLDWLATEFVGRGWSVKAMHKLVMMSSVYRQASLTAPAPPSQGGEIENSGLSTQDSGLSTAASAEVIDPDNVLLWRMPMRRLEAEAIRDSTAST
ncbi:MAG: DUF1553 domain-containing protein, partial [Planctomycetes bacterium]|nr:DUF1553 domain-containing protein [Planctomycetota bacterium]